MSHPVASERLAIRIRGVLPMRASSPSPIVPVVWRWVLGLVPAVAVSERRLSHARVAYKQTNSYEMVYRKRLQLEKCRHTCTATIPRPKPRISCPNFSIISNIRKGVCLAD